MNFKEDSYFLTLKIIPIFFIFPILFINFADLFTIIEFIIIALFEHSKSAINKFA